MGRNEMKFRCGVCDEVVTADTENMGAVVRCPYCESKVRVPEKTNSVADSNGPRKASSSKGEKLRRKTRMKDPQRTSGARPLMWLGVIGAIGAFVLLCIVVATVVSVSSDVPDRKETTETEEKTVAARNGSPSEQDKKPRDNASQDPAGEDARVSEPKSSGKKTQSEQPDTSASKNGGGGDPVVKGRVAAIPIRGGINGKTLELVRSGLREARQQNAEAVVLVLDTPGGLTQSAAKIGAALNSNNAPDKTFAYIAKGKRGGAFSAGALLAFACDQIIMQKGAVIGAAQTVFMSKSSPTGKVPIEHFPGGEKKVSALKARFRAFAEQNDHPGEVVEAMMDTDGTLRVSNAKPRKFRMYYGESSGQKGVVVKPDGDILTLTAGEMKQWNLAQVVDSARELQDGGIIGPGARNLLQSAIYTNLVQRQRSRLRALKRAKKRLGQEFDALISHQRSLGVNLFAKSFKFPQGLLDNTAPKLQHIKKGKRACADIIQLLKKYPSLRVPVSYMKNTVMARLELLQKTIEKVGKLTSKRMSQNLPIQRWQRQGNLIIGLMAKAQICLPKTDGRGKWALLTLHENDARRRQILVNFLDNAFPGEGNRLLRVIRGQNWYWSDVVDGYEIKVMNGQQGRREWDLGRNWDHKDLVVGLKKK